MLYAAPTSTAVVSVPTADDSWITLEQAASRARLHVATLRRAIAAKRLRAIRVNGGRVFRLRASWVDAWLEGAVSI
jgi:excisionase family DNA binding protein